MKNSVVIDAWLKRLSLDSWQTDKHMNKTINAESLKVSSLFTHAESNSAMLWLLGERKIDHNHWLVEKIAFQGII